MSILWPVDNPKVSGEWANSPEFYEKYGQRGHNGIDLAVPIGTPVYATDEGMVVAVGWGQHDSWMGVIAGIFVRLQHNWGFSAVAHLDSYVVAPGTWVARGQLIGYSGATGVGTGPHCHFETFPLSPFFGNGFAGRINPHTFGVVRRDTPNPSKPTEASMKFIEQSSARKSKQIIPAGKERRLAFNDKGDVTLAFGAISIANLSASVRLKGRHNARVQVTVYRELVEKVNGELTVTKVVKLRGARAVFDSLGLAEVAISTAAKLPLNWRIRVAVQPSGGAGNVVVEDFRWTIAHI